MDGEQIYRYSNDEDEWEVYGLVGAGTTFRLWMFDVSCDFLYRIAQDDMDFGNQYASVSVEKPDMILRVALGFEF